MSETQDLAELEMAFAKDPSQFVALTTAYIHHGRFMEAMVVCKKGIKQQPDNAEGRLLLARVYSEQGKVPKAMDELKALLEQKPEVAEAHFFYGQMLEKTGKFEEAIESFKEALRKDRGHEAASAALKAKGVDWSPGPSPEEIAAAEAAKREAEEAEKRRLQEESRKAEEEWKAEEARKAAAAQQSAPSASRGGRRPTPHTTSSPAPAFPADPMYQSAAGAYGMFSGPVPVASAGKRLGPGFTFGLGALLLLVVAVVIAGLAVHKSHQDKIRVSWQSAKNAIKSDTSKGHREGLRYLEEALQVDDGEPDVVAAYAYSLATLAWERGDRDLDAKAKAALKRAMKVAEDKPGSIAAKMMALRNEGKPDEALALAKKLGPDEGLPIQVRAQLGRTYASLGKVPEMLKVADSLKTIPDAMALTFVGMAYRRIGDHGRARNALDGAIKNDLDHDPARALRALTILEDDDVTNLNVAIDDLNTLKELGKDAVGTKQRGYASLGLALVGDRLGRDHRENERELGLAKSVLGSDPELPLFEAKRAMSFDPPDYAKAIELAQSAIKDDRVRLAPYLVIVDAGAHSHNFGAAEKALTDAQAVFGDNLEIGLAKGDLLSRQGKFDEAVAALKAMLAAHDQAEVYRQIGVVFLRADKMNDAVDWLKKAADKAGSRSPAVQANVYTWLGKAYAKAGDHANAVEIFGKSLNATAEYSSTYLYLAASEKALGNMAKAQLACKSYARAEPGNADQCARLLQ